MHLDRQLSARKYETYCEHQIPTIFSWWEFGDLNVCQIIQILNVRRGIVICYIVKTWTCQRKWYLLQKQEISNEKKIRKTKKTNKQMHKCIVWYKYI